jgi:hypothetical protein
MITKLALSKKCPRYEHDEDFDGSDGRNHDDFVPSRSFRYVFFILISVFF